MKTIVIGSINTDIVATGIKQFPKPGEHVYGEELIIGPGGKSRNIAAMIAHLTPPKSVSMISRTVCDPYGLWKIPMDALKEVGVATNFIKIADFKKIKRLPAIALISVDNHGNNQIIVLPGVANDFSTEDIDKAEKLFKVVSSQSGYLVLTLECPLSTAIHAVNLAKKYHLSVILDPGGLEAGIDLEKLIKIGIYLIKPNEHEAKMLTGITVKDVNSAKNAAKKLQAKGIENVFITVGVKGGYLFGSNIEDYIPIPDVKTTGVKDETGCGDQATAAMCAFLQTGKTLKESARLAILAGTLQFHKSGIKPVTLQEIKGH